MEGEVLSDSDLGGPRGAAVILVVLATRVGLGAGGNGGRALVRVSGDWGADGAWLILARGGGSS